MTTKPKRGRPIDHAARAKILKLRQQGMTFAEIGRQFDPPRSKQVVHSMMKRMAEDNACAGGCDGSQ